MKEVPKDGKTIGEIMIKGNIVMKGYFKDKDATEKAMKGGWFHTGDLAVMHQDGYVKIQDRSKDIIISGGENISSIEIENTLAKHPSVLGYLTPCLALISFCFSSSSLFQESFHAH